MKQITFEEAFAEQLKSLESQPGITQEELDISFDDFKLRYLSIGGSVLSDEKLRELHNRRNIYADGSEKQIGDKLIFFLIPKSNGNDIEVTMVSKTHRTLYELNDKYDFYENLFLNGQVSILPYACEKGSKESEIYAKSEIGWAKQNGNDVKELIEKWKLTGLLDECQSDVEEMDLCNLLEKAMEVSDKDDAELMSVIFPLVTRVYYKLRSSTIDVARLCEIFATNKSVLYELPKYGDDSEAEYVAYCESIYVDEYNKSLV